MVTSEDRWQLYPHLNILNELLLYMDAGQFNRLMTWIPPQHGKSELISRYFPVWHLGHHPNNRVILSSYEADFAATWGRKARDIFKEWAPPIFGLNLREDSSSVKHWDIFNNEGGMDTSGAGGSQTGKKADVFDIDDPHKNPQEARSKVFQERIYDWYLEAVDTRLAKDGILPLTQTRWDYRDLSGRILYDDDGRENEPHLYLNHELLNDLREGEIIGRDTWVILHLPAIAIKDDDIVGRKKGEALSSLMFPLDVLLAKQNRMKSSFTSLYQGLPTPLEGNLLKKEWLHGYDKLPTHGNTIIYQGWDMAISEKTTADYTCSATIIHDILNNKIYIHDWTRDHIDFPKQVQKVLGQYQRFNPIIMGFEDVAYQRALPQQVQENSQNPLPIKLVPRVADKVARITTRFVLFENNTVFVNKNHPLYSEFEREFVTFNNGVHDDLLDATELALSLAMKGSNPYTDTDSYYDYSPKPREDKDKPRFKSMMHRRGKR